MRTGDARRGALYTRRISDAFVRATYAIIPIGLAGVLVGIAWAVIGYPAIGIPVLVLGACAATLALSKLRATKRWPFSDQGARRS